MANEGINKLGRVLQKRMGEVAYTPPSIDLGTIRSDMALVPDGLNLVIPRGDYSVMRHNEALDLDGGDRVVVAWIDSEPVVLGKIGG